MAEDIGTEVRYNVGCMLPVKIRIKAAEHRRLRNIGTAGRI